MTTLSLLYSNVCKMDEYCNNSQIIYKPLLRILKIMYFNTIVFKRTQTKKLSLLIYDKQYKVKLVRLFPRL